MFYFFTFISKFRKSGLNLIFSLFLFPEVGPDSSNFEAFRSPSLKKSNQNLLKINRRNAGYVIFYIKILPRPRLLHIQQIVESDQRQNFQSFVMMQHSTNHTLCRLTEGVGSNPTLQKGKSSEVFFLRVLHACVVKRRTPRGNRRRGWI